MAFVLLTFLTQPATAFAQIAPDGATATSVATPVNGPIAVSIAPSGPSGISHNTYTHFNVPIRGVDLDNRSVRANTIVNEVTSTSPSILQGPLAVVGSRANVIVANPNGISADGASFVNVGSVALASSKVSFFDFENSPGSMRRNILLDTTGGAIDIGPRGLSGAFNRLDLISKAIRIDGPVKNNYDLARDGIRIVAGDSHAEIDGSIDANDNLSQWVNLSTPGNSGSGILQAR